MLVLTMRAGDRIFVGDSLIVTAVRTGATSIRIGFEAPKSTRIVREKIADGIPSIDVELPEGVDGLEVSTDELQALAGVGGE
jgi:carbon storage regulator